ncbi:11-beta-hydroxysteroid dehydrogenase-like 6, partial [Mucuna pruriens]
MKGINKLLNVVLPPLSLILLSIFMLPFLLFKQLMYVKRLLYTENVSNKVVVITGAASGIGEARSKAIPVDHLVNNAGISGKLEEVENWRDVSDFTPVM